MKPYKNALLISVTILLFIAVIIARLWQAGIIVFDYAEFVAREYVRWNGREYSLIGGEYSEGKTVARDKNDFSMKIKEVNEDPSHTFIVVRSFLDQSLLVADDYEVPTSGELTTVCWDEKYIKDSQFLEAVSRIYSERKALFSYATDGIWIEDENHKMEALYFAYDGCPVTTNFIGYMGKVYGKWAITTYISNDTRNPDGSPKEYRVDCYEIPEEYGEILSKYWG